jgi:4-carboxymuconolactone decarboxylase
MSPIQRAAALAAIAAFGLHCVPALSFTAEQPAPGRPVKRERGFVKTVALLGLASLLAGPLLSHGAPPPRSVFMADYSSADLDSAIASGRTTLIYSGGSSMAVANHVEVARYVARRVAEELGNALVLPVTADTPGLPRASAGRGAIEPYDVVNRALHSARFTNIVIVADEGTGPSDRRMQELAERVRADWGPSGVHVQYVTAHEIRPGQGMTMNADYLRRWAGRTVQAEHRKTIEDQAELLYVDPERKWLRRDAVAAADRTVVVPAVGKMLLEQRVSAILNRIRSDAPHAVPVPASPQNRLSAIPEDKITEPLRRALTEYREVRPDGLGEAGGAGADGGVGAGGPNLWTVYVHLPEILAPLRQLHEQSHVNPRISQKLIHFVIMIVARHWTNDIWTAHEDDAIREGLGRDTVKALEEGRFPEHMAEDEAAAYDFCTELLENKRVSDATYARAVTVLGEESVVQMAVTAGLYTYLSMAVNMAYPESAASGRLPPFPR